MYRNSSSIANILISADCDCDCDLSATVISFPYSFSCREDATGKCVSDGLWQGRLLSEQAVGSPDRKRTHKTVEPGRRVGAEDEEGGVGLHVDPGAAADGVEPPAP